LIEVGWQDSLLSGIWPRSVTLWMTVFWMALFIIRPWEKLVPELAEWRVERMWAIAAIAVVVASGSLRLCNSFQTTAVLLFIAALAFCSLCAFDDSAAWEGLYKYLTLAVFHFVLLSAIRTPYQLFFVATSYIVVLGVYLGKSEYEYFLHGAGQYTMGVRRLTGIESTYGGPNAVAASAVLSLPILSFLWRIRREFTETWSRTWRVSFPLCLVLYFLLATSAIILTNSRSGMLGFVVFMFLAAITGRKLRGKLVGLATAALILAVTWVAMPEESKNRLRTVWDPSRGPANAQASAAGRIEGMKAGIAMFQRSPMTGVGISNFIPYRITEVDGVALNAHSLIGEILGETGLLGTGTFLLLLAALYANCRRTAALAKQCPNATLRTLSRLTDACWQAAMLLLFFGLFSHNLSRFNWLWLAAFALLGRMFAEKTYTAVDESEELEWGPA